MYGCYLLGSQFATAGVPASLPCAYRKQHSNARYLAIRAVCLLDQLVDGSAGVVADNGLEQAPNEEDLWEVQAARRWPSHDDLSLQLG
jgi:hypothetical protein